MCNGPRPRVLNVIHASNIDSPVWKLYYISLVYIQTTLFACVFPTQNFRLFNYQLMLEPLQHTLPLEIPYFSLLLSHVPSLFSSTPSKNAINSLLQSSRRSLYEDDDLLCPQAQVRQGSTISRVGHVGRLPHLDLLSSP